MKVLLVEVNERPTVAEIKSDLRSLRAILCRNGGHIEVVYPFEDNVGIICNDEGKLLSLPLNRALRNENGDVYDFAAAAAASLFSFSSFSAASSSANLFFHLLSVALPALSF